MTELEIKIIKFLLSAAVYSETAIMKNLGIDEKTLKNSFIILEKNGYLEPYSNFIKRESLNEKKSCCKTKTNKSCSSCKASSQCSLSSNCCSNNIFSDMKDFSKIKVLTNKAVDEFY